ncbi:acyltransferase family protein [Thiothrix lacustris]|uniref:Acyltransferase n=1 Tax=Thiothrix lacustris TaxID=525917 RepID=A0ABY9MLH6_9GAMM|nr:acyltransferase [Thiothrix lacustris]WML89515.1 acyltransferase [Thiothrix lacustris]WMP18937.1 acyltransferase [Thiothrix lacustris]
MEQISVKGQRFLALDALRGLAALWVVYFHIYGGLGYLAVDFFLVLSGFILVHRYWYAGKPVTPREFINHRLARLYPLHLYTLLVFVLVHWLIYWKMPSFRDGALFTFIQQLTLTHNIGLSPQGLTWNYPAWSVSVEFFVNILFIFLITRQTRSGTLFLLGTFGILVLFMQHGQLNTQSENYFGIVNSGLLRGMSSFLLGILSYRVYLFYQDDWRVARYAIWLEMLCVLAVMGIIVSRTGSSMGMDVFVPYLALLMVAIFACEQGWLSRGLRKLAYLGEISYSVYLNHLVVLMIFRYFAKQYGWDKPVILGLTFVTVLVYSHFTYRYLEIPLGKAWRKGLTWLTTASPSPRT